MKQSLGSGGNSTVCHAMPLDMVMSWKLTMPPLCAAVQMVPALLANWKLWPAAQLINFTLIPEDQRILYGNVVGICWTCVISNMQQASGDEQAAGSTDSAEAQQAGELVPAAGSAAAAAAGPDARLRMPVVGRLVDAVFSQRKRSSTSLAA
jgi:hypothetical protein